MIKLSKRLSCIADMVPAGARLADVGCDHGYLSISLLQDKKIASSWCLDINDGPLDRAREHADAENLHEDIYFLKSDGLMKMPSGNVDTVVIAGMGGALVTRIMEQCPPAVKGEIKKWILSPQSEIPEFRKKLRENRYKIEEERIVLEEGKFYFVISVVSGKQENVYENTLDQDIADSYGLDLLKKNDPVLKELLIRECKLADGILKSDSLPDKRRQEIEYRKSIAEGALHYYEMQ